MTAERLLDHHCHGVVPGVLDRDQFEGLISESSWPAPERTSHFDSPIGLAIRRYCAPVLGLDRHAAADVYLKRRAALGDEANHQLLATARLGGLVIETGYRTEDVLGPADMGELAGCPAYEVVRLEAVAEEVAASGVTAEGYADAFVDALTKAAGGAVGLKTIVAYRGGFTLDWTSPSRKDVTDAAGRWLAAGGGRLTDPVLLRFGLWTGAELARGRMPIQFHTGYGDADITLHHTNPSLLTPLLRAWDPLGVTVTLLHCYPYHREAAYLAAVFPHVYFDVGLALNYTGPNSGAVLGEAMELAPFTKQLYSSDAFGLAELHYLGAVQFRRALDRVLGGWVAAGDCTAADADHIAQLLGWVNAARIYPLNRAP